MMLRYSETESLCADLDLILRNRRIEHLIFTGVCTDVCVHSSIAT